MYRALRDEPYPPHRRV